MISECQGWGGAKGKSTSPAPLQPNVRVREAIYEYGEDYAPFRLKYRLTNLL